MDSKLQSFQPYMPKAWNCTINRITMNLMKKKSLTPHYTRCQQFFFSFFWKGPDTQILNTLGFVGGAVFITTTQFCLCSMEAATDDM